MTYKLIYSRTFNSKEEAIDALRNIYAEEDLQKVVDQIGFETFVVRKDGTTTQLNKFLSNGSLQAGTNVFYTRYKQDGLLFQTDSEQVNEISGRLYGSIQPTLYWSRDGVTWMQWGYMVNMVSNKYDLLQPLEFSKTNPIYIKGDNPLGLSHSIGDCLNFQFLTDAPVYCNGDVMSLLGTNVRDIPNAWCFSGLFESCVQLVTAPSISSNIMLENCCDFMFSGCESLVSAPELPAMELDVCCYANMFSGCTSLVDAPELPATTLSPYCYENMFSGCESLTHAPVLPAMELADGCYASMFSDCSSLVDAPELPSMELAVDCYGGMFYRCTSLVDAPELPALVLNAGCYMEMFRNCECLINAPTLPAETMTESCYANMFAGCTSLEKAPELPAVTLAERCYEYMFRNCTAMVDGPSSLPAKTTAPRCYAQMFESCTSLVNAPILYGEELTERCYNGMFTNCTQLVEFTTYQTAPPTNAFCQYWLKDTIGGNVHAPNKSQWPSGYSRTNLYHWTVV